MTIMMATGLSAQALEILYAKPVGPPGSAKHKPQGQVLSAAKRQLTQHVCSCHANLAVLAMWPSRPRSEVCVLASLMEATTARGLGLKLTLQAQKLGQQAGMRADAACS